MHQGPTPSTGTYQLGNLSLTLQLIKPDFPSLEHRLTTPNVNYCKNLICILFSYSVIEQIPIPSLPWAGSGTENATLIDQTMSSILAGKNR
jgi:hypothetical protein